MRLQKNVGKDKTEIDIKALKKRLIILLEEDNIEIVHLCIQSMLEELNE